MNIYIETISKLTINLDLLEEYLQICEKYSQYNNKKEAETFLNCKVELHHILPKCFKLGGEKDKLNYTFLPLIEHREVHKILKDMFSGNKRKQMSFAYSRIIHRHESKEELSNEDYIELKTEISKLIGELNSSRIITDEYRNNMSKVKSNTFWVNNGTQEIMLNPNISIPNGFIKGRISNQNKGRVWINDGNENKMVTANYIIPSGWDYGMIRKTKV